MEQPPSRGRQASVSRQRAPRSVQEALVRCKLASSGLHAARETERATIQDENYKLAVYEGTQRYRPSTSKPILQALRASQPAIHPIWRPHKRGGPQKRRHHLMPKALGRCRHKRQRQHNWQPPEGKPTHLRQGQEE